MHHAEWGIKWTAAVMLMAVGLVAVARIDIRTDQCRRVMFISLHQLK
ncbi:hypothetical protein GSbR_00080 [Geobacter sp. SVR]|nr:hypothetical protein GSVR_37140 [Geobacter sp. SVR]GCF83408.1 hypothetical protein GSbR_00080 [Geobacter sp. SVR]